jgi:PAS domain S-box-containing protein
MVEKMTPDGRWWYIHGYPVKDDNGNTKAMVELTLDITERKQSEEKLRENENKLQALLISIPDHMSMMDREFNILWANDTAERLFGNDIIGKKCYEVYHQRTSPCEPQPCITKRAFGTGKSHSHVTEVVTNDGSSIHFHCTASVALKEDSGQPTAVLEISRDVTNEKKLESELTTKAAELETKSHNLKEMNTALRVLLKEREKDKADVEDKVLSNVKDLVLPYIERIKKTSLNSNQRSCIDIIKSNLEEIVSPFARELSSKFLGLTPTEIRVANLVKEGKTTKEVANLLHLSAKTVEVHRKNLRRKLGIKNKKTNLRTQLMSVFG